MISQITPAGIRPGQAGEIDRRLRLAGALEHAAGARPEREHVTGLDDVPRALRRVDRDLNRAGAIGGGDAGRDTFARLDRLGERRAVRRLVVMGHGWQPELVATLRP